NVSRSLGGDQFVGELGAKRAQQIKITNKKWQMRVVGDCVQAVDLQGEMSPVFKKLPNHRERQFSFPKLRHEKSLVDLFVPCLVKCGVKIVHIGFGVGFSHLFAGFGLSRFVHFASRNVKFSNYYGGYHRPKTMSS